MLDGKLRIAPTCYHVLHQVPVMTAHEMNFFYDEGLKTADGSFGYEILTDSMVPFGLEKLGISQAMKEKSVDIALDVQSRTVFYQRARGADLYIISGWRNQHTNVWVGAAAYQVAAGPERQARRHQRLQQHSPLGDPDSTQKGRSGFGERHRVGAHRRQLAAAFRRDPQRQSRVRAGAALVRRRSEGGRLQCAGVAGGSVSRRPARAHHRRHRTDSRGAARPGERFSQGDDSLLLVRARHAEELRIHFKSGKAAAPDAVPIPKSAWSNICARRRIWKRCRFRWTAEPPASKICSRKKSGSASSITTSRRSKKWWPRIWSTRRFKNCARARSSMRSFNGSR